MRGLVLWLFWMLFLLATWPSFNTSEEWFIWIISFLGSYAAIIIPSILLIEQQTQKNMENKYQGSIKNLSSERDLLKSELGILSSKLLEVQSELSKPRSSPPPIEAEAQIEKEANKLLPAALPETVSNENLKNKALEILFKINETEGTIKAKTSDLEIKKKEVKAQALRNQIIGGASYKIQQI